jgi:hypothetical protein
LPNALTEGGDDLNLVVSGKVFMAGSIRHWIGPKLDLIRYVRLNGILIRTGVASNPW